jgi:putative Holliday junction resolvase
MTQPRSLPLPARRVLAVDPGSRRIGVAIADELGLYAHARPAILLRPGADAVEAIAKLAEGEHADELVVGLPLSLSGADSAQTRSVRALVAGLRRRLVIPITEWDERLSTVQAARGTRSTSRRRTGDLDSAAAATVLQSVLDSRRERGEA